MAIFGIGAYYDGERDVSREFIQNDLAGVGYSEPDAPEIHRYVRSLKVGDIVYIKAFSPSSPDLHVKAIGLIADDEALTAAQTNGLVGIGRRVHWVVTDPFSFPKPHERNNVRANTIYEEFHPAVQQVIIQRLLGAFRGALQPNPRL
jgi:hypothetical protein